MRKSVSMTIASLLFCALYVPSDSSVKGASISKVNDYIVSNHLQTAKIEEMHISSLPKLPYRNGVGKVEGIVIHETSNPNSTITGEIDYMKLNSRNAFVHGFVDHGRIIETHPTDYKAWGAGPAANGRFIHIELVQVHSFDQFARSINNFAYYTAFLLKKYHLSPSSAENSGKGTLWSHKAVTRHLGGTSHVDPHGYFQQWGYSWEEFVQLVTIKYNQLQSSKKVSTSRLGKIRNNKVTIYNHTLQQGRTVSQDEMKQVFYIKQQWTVNGVLYYLLHRKPSKDEATAVGWVKAGDVSSYTHQKAAEQYRTGQYVFTGTGNAYNQPWGGAANLVLSDLSNYTGKALQVNLVEAVGSNIWVRGKIDNHQIWLHSRDLVQIKESATSRLGQLKNERISIYKTPGIEKTIKKAGPYLGQVYYIKKQAIANGKTYYLLATAPSATKGILGWVKAEGLTTHSHKTVNKKKLVLYPNGKGVAYNKAWGGTKNVVYPSLAPKKNKAFHVNLTEKVGNNTWYRGTLDGKTVWIHSSRVGAKK